MAGPRRPPRGAPRHRGQVRSGICAISNNPNRRWSMTNTQLELGYRPRDAWTDLPRRTSTSSRAARRCETTGPRLVTGRRGRACAGRAADPRRAVHQRRGRRAGRPARAERLLLHESVESLFVAVITAGALFGGALTAPSSGSWPDAGARPADPRRTAGSAAPALVRRRAARSPLLAMTASSMRCWWRPWTSCCAGTSAGPDRPAPARPGGGAADWLLTPRRRSERAADPVVAAVPAGLPDADLDPQRRRGWYPTSSSTPRPPRERRC